MDKKTQEIKKNSKLIKDLLENNPDIVVAQKIMEQAKLTKKASVTIDQTNYYKLPVQPKLSHCN